MVRQIAKDLKKFKEDLLQSELDKENREKAINADDEQLELEQDFRDALNDIKRLGNCFWRFQEVEPVFDSVVKNLIGIMEKRRRQLNFYVDQIRGQFGMIAERIAKQREQFETVNEHLRREEEFRQKVFNRETKEVMRLVREYEMLVQQHTPLVEPRKDLHYSELLPDLTYIQQQLENAQLNIDLLRVFNEPERPADFRIVEDAKNERVLRQRKIQVNTAKRVLKRFWVDTRGRVEKGTQTDAEEIAIIKNFYEDQMDALMERQIENDTIQQKLNNRLQQHQHLIEQRDRKIDEQKDLLENRAIEIEELNIAKEVLMTEAKEKEREYSKTFHHIEELKKSLYRREQTNMKYLQTIQSQKDAVNKLEAKMLTLNKEKNQAELDLMQQT